MGSYVKPDADELFYTPVGAMIFYLLEHIAWQYPSVRDIVSYMKKLNVSGGGTGIVRPWDLEVLSSDTRMNISKLQQGIPWNEWGMVL